MWGKKKGGKEKGWEEEFLKLNKLKRKTHKNKNLVKIAQ